jgi:hypothetical protein
MQNSDWPVIPHDAPVQLADNLWRVEGDIPNMGIRRCMVVARLTNGDLFVHNAMALDEAGMSWLDGLGRVAWVMVPNAFHRMDCGRYKARYPGAKIVCPRGSGKKVRERVAVDHTLDELPGPPGDESVTWRHLDGMKGVEGVVTIRSGDGATLVLNDSMFNVEGGSGFFWWVYGTLLRSSGGPKVTPIARAFMVKDKKALGADFVRLSETPDLQRIIVAHGDVIDDRAAEVLREVASTL